MAFESLSRIIAASAAVDYKSGLAINKYNKSGVGRKVHEKQLSFHRDRARNRWIFGGNRTGKTECGAAEAVFWATGVHPYRTISGATEGWVVSLSARFTRDVAQAKFLKYLDKTLIADIVMLAGKRGAPERGIIDYVLVRNRFGSLSKISFKSCDQGREKFQGASLDWIWFDEEPPFDIYEECLLRTLDKPGSCIWGTMTPLKGRTWVYEKIYMNAGIAGGEKQTPDLSGSKQPAAEEENTISCTFMSWEDNPYLSPAEIKKMQGALSADALESRKYGRFAEGTGLVFNNFSAENVIESFQIEKGWYTAVSIDPGYTNPLAALFIAVDADENIYVVADYEVAELTVPEHARRILAISDRLGFQKNKHGRLNAFIDSAATARTLGSPESVAAQFGECGIDVNPKVNKDVAYGIQRLKSLFCNVDGVRKIFIFANCTNLIRELRGYFWGAEERPVKAHDHCIDALRYFVTSDIRAEIPPKPVPASERKNIVAEAKRAFIRRNRAYGF